MEYGLTNQEADAIAIYLSGAASDGAAQPDVNLSLGNYRSSSRAEILGCKILEGIPNVRILRWSGGITPGEGAVNILADDRLAFSAPGDSGFGPGVEVLDGETKTLYSYQSHHDYVVVTRTTDDDMTGQFRLMFTESLNNLIGMSNVTSAEAVAGVEKLRCLVFKNNSSSDIYDLTVWIADGDIQIAKEAPSSGHFSIADNENDADIIAALSWNSGNSYATGLSIGTLAAGAIYGLWLRLTIAADTDAAAYVRSAIQWSYQQ